MSQPVISVEHLTKKYDLGVIGTGTISRDLNRWWARIRKQPDPYTRIGQRDAFERIGESILALDDVSFTVEQGEALGIIGRNGAGKSTLLKILSRVTAPTSGVVKVKGRIGSLLEVGTGFHPELTGRENIYLNGAILGMKKAEVARKFDEIVDFAEVEKFIDTPVKRYSSGMYVRLAFAVAAHLESEILIVDEVLAVGDAEFQKKCLGKMGDVSSKEGRTVLFVSHNMGAILQMCEFCLLISKGNKELLDYSSIVINKYLETKDNLTQENLLSRTDRRGNGICRVSEVYVENGQGFRNPVIKSGQALKFIFLMNKEVENYEFTFGIYDTAGIHIAGFQTKNKSEDDKLDSIINKKIICDIPELTLTPGNYSINCYLVSNGILEDHIENAYKFQVVEGDYNGRFIKSGGFAKIIMQHKWTTTFH